jgi:transcription initiation factor IIE alpha subunit
MKKYIILLVLILVSCTSKPRMITAKHMTGETYWMHRYKQKALQIDDKFYKMLDSLNNSSVYVKESKYYFCLDGLEFVEVDAFNYNYKKEGEYYKE